MVLDRIVVAYGGASALARRLGITRNAMTQWKRAGRIPVGRVLEIERLTGVPRHEIRPDIYPPPGENRAA